jgi:hypothetical protein
MTIEAKDKKIGEKAENKKREEAVSFGGQSLDINGQEENGIAVLSKVECVSCVHIFLSL